MIVVVAIPLVIEISVKKKLFAVPNHRSAHQEKVIPNLGGIAIFAAVLISAMINVHGFTTNTVIELLLGSLVLFLIGLVDDLIVLSAYKKLIGQILISSYLILVCDIRFTNLHGIFGINEINTSLGYFISLITIIGLVNGFNLIDGIDGLAAGIGTLISATFGYLFLYYGFPEYSVFAFSIAGALVAFFFFNVFGKKNKIFMGDTGSLSLGILFALFTIILNEIKPAPHFRNINWTVPAITMAIMIVPVVDSIRVMVIRLIRKSSPFTPDMNHIHHELLKITKNHLQASIIVVLANLFLVCLAFGLINILGNAILFVVILALGFTLAAVPGLINRYRLLKETEIIEDVQSTGSVFFKKIQISDPTPENSVFASKKTIKSNGVESPTNDLSKLGNIQTN